ncbi:MAG: hypothetical protein HZA14_03010 [Nitrospirae bacterium]|nr:hypothetical protein [Nitrospirota bacterium]
MMKEKLLFVTKGGEDCDNGFTYILELAKTLNAAIAMLMVYSKNAMQTYEDVMAAVAFAEAGDHAMVKELMQGEEKRLKETVNKKVEEMAERCRENSVPFTYRIDADETITSIKHFLKNSPGVDMVLLSPNLSENKKEIDLKKLIKNITKPICAISVPIKAEA